MYEQISKNWEESEQVGKWTNEQIHVYDEQVNEQWTNDCVRIGDCVKSGGGCARG